MEIQSLSNHLYADGLFRGSFLVHKTFLEPESKTVLQHSPKHLKKLIWHNPSLRKPQDSKLMRKDVSCQAKQFLFNSLRDFKALRDKSCFFFLLSFFSILKQFPIYSSCLGECCKTVWLWSQVWWTTKLHLILEVLQLTWREHCRCSIGQGLLPAAREVRDFPDKYPIVCAELELLHQLFGFRQLQVFHCDRPLQLTHFIGEIFNFFLV